MRRVPRPRFLRAGLGRVGRVAQRRGTGGAEMSRGIRAMGFLERGAAPFGFKGAGFDSHLLLESNPSEFSPLLFPDGVAQR